MVNSLAVIFSTLNDKIEILLFIGVILTIMGIIIWVYVVKTKRLLSKLEKKLNDINYISEIRLVGSGNRTALTEEELKEYWFISKTDWGEMKNHCPKCYSERITLYRQYKKNKRTGNGDGGGCLGCLLLLIILIIAPGAVLIFGLITGAAIYALRIPLLIGLLVGVIIAIVVKVRQSGLIICEKCGHKFK